MELAPEHAEARLELGHLLEEQGALEEAARLYREVTRLRPEDVGAYELAGRAYLRAGAFAEAVAAFRQLVARKPSDAIALQDLGVALARTGQNEEAISMLARSLEQRPGHLATILELARASAKAERSTDAVDHYRLALGLEPGNTQASLELAQLLEKLGRPQDTIATLEAAVNASPRDSQALLRLGTALQEGNRLHEAVDALETALTHDGTLVDAYRRLAAIHRKLGAHAAAAAACEELFRRGAHDADTLVDLAEARRALGEDERVVRALEQALSIDPEHQRAHRLRATVAAQRGQHEEAVRSYEAVLKKQKTDVDALYGVALSYLALRRRGEAIDALRAATEIDPDHADAFLTLGRTHQSMLAHREAAAAFRAVTRIREDAGAFLALAETERDLGRFDDAVTSIHQAVRLASRDPAPLVLLGDLLTTLDRLPEAVSALERVTQLPPSRDGSSEHVEAYRRLSTLHAKLGDRPRAVRALVALGEAGGHTAETLVELARHEVALGHPREALDAVRRAVKRADNLDAHLLRGELALELQQFTEAAEAYERVLEQKSQLPPALFGLALANLGAHKTKEALLPLQLLVQVEPSHLEAQQTLGSVLLERDRAADALEPLRTAARLAPSDARTHLQLATAYRATGQAELAELAVGSYLRSLELSPHSARPWLDLGLTYVDLGRRADAIDAFEDALEREPSLLIARRSLGIALEEQGRHADAVHALWPLLEAPPPDDALALRHLAQALSHLGKPSDALPVAHRSVRADRRDKVAKKLLADLYALAGDQVNASELYEDLLRRDAQDAGAAFGLARALHAQKREPERAFQLAKTATELDPTNPDAHLLFGRMLVTQERWLDAASSFARVRRLRPTDGEAALRHGEMLQRTGDLAAAREALAHAVERMPEDGHARFNLGVALLKLGDADNAIDAFEHAVAKSPTEGSFRAALAVAYAQRGRTLEAVDQYEEAMRAGLRSGELSFGYGILLEQVGRPVEAVSQLAQAAKLRPNHVEGHRRLGQLRAKLGRDGEAVESFWQAVRLDTDEPDLRIELGACLARLGQREAALEQLRILEDLDRDAGAQLARLIGR